MNYVKRILSVVSVMAMTAFAAPALAVDSSANSIVGSEQFSSGPSPSGSYGSPNSIVGSEQFASKTSTPVSYKSPNSIVGGEQFASKPSTPVSYSSPNSIVGSTPVEPIAAPNPTGSGFDWTDGLVGLVAGLALAGMAMGSARLLRERRPATSRA